MPSVLTPSMATMTSPWIRLPSAALLPGVICASTKTVRAAGACVWRFNPTVLIPGQRTRHSAFLHHFIMKGSRERLNLFHESISQMWRLLMGVNDHWSSWYPKIYLQSGDLSENTMRTPGRTQRSEKWSAK